MKMQDEYNNCYFTNELEICLATCVNNDLVRIEKCSHQSNQHTDIHTNCYNLLPAEICYACVLTQTRCTKFVHDDV